MKRANSEGAVISGEHLLCGSTNRLFFCLPQLHLLHSSFLAARTQPVEMRETPFGMSDKHTFEMTCSFHVLARHKVRMCVSCIRGEWKIHCGLRRQHRCLISCLWRWTYNTAHHTTQYCVYTQMRMSLNAFVVCVLTFEQEQQHKNAPFIFRFDLILCVRFVWVSKFLRCIFDSDIANLAIYHISYLSRRLIIQAYAFPCVLKSIPKSLINFSLCLHRISFLYAIKNSHLPLCRVEWDECTRAVRTWVSSSRYFEVNVFNSGAT